MFDGILESATIAVSLEHDLDEGLIDHVSFLLTVTVGKRHFLSSDDCGKRCDIGRNLPVDGYVSEGCLAANMFTSVRKSDAVLL